MTHLKDLAKQSLIYGLGDTLYRAVAFFLLPLYLKHLSPGEYGTVESLLVTRGLVVTLIAMGFPNAIFRFYYRTKDEGARKSIVSTIFFISIFFQIGGALLLLWRNEFISSLIFKSPDFAFLISILSVNIFLTTFRQIPLFLYRAQNRALAYSAVTFTVAIVTLLTNVWFVAYQGKGVLGVILGNLCGGATGLIMVLPTLLREIDLSFDTSGIKDILSYAVPLGLALLPLNIIFIADRYFIVRLASLHELGIYALASKFATILNVFLFMPFTLAWGPFVFSNEREENAEAIYSTATNYFVRVSLWVLVLISVIHVDVIKLLTKNIEFYAATKVVPILCYANFFYGLSFVLTVGIKLTGKTYYTTGIMTLGMCMNLTMNLLLIPLFGVIGAACSLLATFLVVCALSYRYSIKLYWVDYELGKIATFLVASIAVVILSQVLNAVELRYSFVARMSLIGFFSVYTFISVESIRRRKTMRLSTVLSGEPFEDGVNLTT